MCWDIGGRRRGFWHDDNDEYDCGDSDSDGGGYNDTNYEYDGDGTDLDRE